MRRQYEYSIADPWLERHDYDEEADFNSLGTIYMGEQSLDTMLQLVEMDRVKPCPVPQNADHTWL